MFAGRFRIDPSVDDSIYWLRLNSKSNKFDKTHRGTGGFCSQPYPSDISDYDEKYDKDEDYYGDADEASGAS